LSPFKEENLRGMVTGELTTLRKSLDADFERQRAALLAAFNEEIGRALRPVDRIKAGDDERIDLRHKLILNEQGCQMEYLHTSINNFGTFLRL
jgi:hypothetical protein